MILSLTMKSSERCLKKLTSDFDIDGYSLIKKLSIPACLIDKGNIICKNSAFIKAQIKENSLFEKRITADDKIYKAVSSQLEDEIELFIFEDITYIDTLLKENSRLKIEMEMAKNIQSSLMKKSFPEISGYRFSIAYFPSSEVGGDLYDVIPLDNGKVLIYVADVSGHGVAAAMMTVFFKQEISIFCRHSNFSFKRLIVFLNERLNELNCGDKVYLTLFLAIIDTNTGDLKYYNAGHSAIPLLRRNDGEVEELYSPGVPICTWGLKAEYKIRRTYIDMGERLVLYTDGIFPGKDYELAFENFKKMFGSKEYSNEKFIEEVSKKATDRPEDDMLMIICERTQAD